MKNPLLSSQPARNSFLPQDYINDRNDARANIFTLTLFAIVMAGVVGAFFVTNRHWRALRDEQHAIDLEYEAESAKIEQLKVLEAQRSSIMEKAEITAALIEKVPRWAVLGEVTLRMPTTMRLDQFVIKSSRVVKAAPAATTAPGAKSAPQSLVKKIAGDGKDAKKTPERPKVEAPKFDYTMTIEGTADINNDVTDFLAGLNKSPIFSKVELAYIKDSKESGVDLRKFQITAVINSNSKPDALAKSLQDLVNTRTAGLSSTDSDKTKKPVTDTKSAPILDFRQGTPLSPTADHFPDSKNGGRP